MTDLLAHVEQSILAQKLLSRGQGVVVAVSGGLDSMVLLHLLHQLAAKHRWKMVVAHFNHRLRGRSSDADERLVRYIAVSRGLPFVAGRGSVRARARATGQSLEMAARELRHAFLARTALERKCQSIALAHHANDQLELFFLRLLRGAGSDGLSGMKWRARSPADGRVQLIRPLLDAGKLDLAAFAREHNLRFREDASNASLDYLRNRIRHELLPNLESRYQPGLAKTVLRLMDILGAESEFITGAAEQWLAVGRQAFDTLSPAVQRRAVQLQLRKLGVAAEFQTIEWLRQRPNSPITFNPETSVFRDKAGCVRVRGQAELGFRPDEMAVLLSAREGDASFGGLRFRWRIVASRSTKRGPGELRREYFDADKIGASITLRRWRPGDRFQPIGMFVPVKLQNWFTNQKIPAARRRELVLATTADGEVFWVEGQRISEPFKLTSATRRRLVWCWKRA